MKIRLNLFRALLRVILPETSRYAIGGWHVTDQHIEVTDTRMLAIVPLEPEHDDERAAPNTFATPFALPASTGTRREDFLGKIRLRLGRRRAVISNSRGQAVTVRPIEGTWPDTAAVVPTDAPTYSTHLSPILFEKALAIFRAAVANKKIDDLAITIEFRADKHGNERVIVMRQPATNVVVYLMPVRRWRPDEDEPADK